MSDHLEPSMFCNSTFIGSKTAAAPIVGISTSTTIPSRPRVGTYFQREQQQDETDPITTHRLRASSSKKPAQGRETSDSSKSACPEEVNDSCGIRRLQTDPDFTVAAPVKRRSARCTYSGPTFKLASDWPNRYHHHLTFAFTTSRGGRHT